MRVEDAKPLSQAEFQLTYHNWQTSDKLQAVEEAMRLNQRGVETTTIVAVYFPGQGYGLMTWSAYETIHRLFPEIEEVKSL